MTIGFTCGAFDLLHAGHVHMLEFAKSQCDCLKVGLQTNPRLDRPEKHRPVQSVYERWVQLKALSCVNEIIPYDTEHDLLNILAAEAIHIRFVGEEYINLLTEMTGFDVCNQRGITIHFTPRLHDYSSTELRQRVAQMST